MFRRFSFVLALLIAALAAVALSACGGGGSGGAPKSAEDLLKQTFASGHKVTSGKITAAIGFDGSGLKQLTGPLSVTVNGPFQGQGKGNVPKVDLTIGLKTSNSGVDVGLVSTGDKGYLKLQKQAFVLDDATFNKLKQSYQQSASTSGGNGGPTLSSLGIDPLRWLTNPKIAGTETVGGADTYHVSAGVNVASFTGDLSTLLQKASALSSTTKLPGALSAQQRQDITRSVRSATFDLWTGKDDKTLRRLRLVVDIAVPAAVQPRAGGLKSGRLAIDFTIADLNKDQTISAPANPQPFSQLQSLLGGVTGGGTSATPGTTGASPAPGASSSSKYLQCLAAAGNDVAKVQQCQSLTGQ